MKFNVSNCAAMDPLKYSPDGVERKDGEESRIREAYARRQGGHKAAYSFLDASHVLQIQERDREMLSMLSRHGVDCLDAKNILEIGCGTGYWLRAFLQWGALPENLCGIDLLPERIAQAKTLCPQGVRVECGSAASLDYPDASFDFVLQSTVFSSILDSAMRYRIAAEMLRVAKPDGFALWYDLFFDNPGNPDVRGVRLKEIRELFPRCRIFSRRITLAPPIGRFVGRYSPLLYALLTSTRILCTHYLCLIRKK